MSDDDKALAIPQVTTLARPSTNVLLAARYEMVRNEKLRSVFEQFRGQPDKADALTEIVLDFLYSLIKGEESEIREVSRYLVDEFFQLGDTGLIISRETGLPLARITEKDIWQPPPVARENPDGSMRMVPQKPRLRPELEGALVRHEFERGREHTLLKDLSSRVLQTSFLKEQGDRRLATVTRAGRADFVEALRADLPSLLPGDTRGKARRFLDFFSMSEPYGEALEGLEAFPKLTAFARVDVSIADHKARNFRHDQAISIRARLSGMWVHNIAGKISSLAHELHPGEPIDFGTVYNDNSFWVAGGSVLDALHQILSSTEVLPVQDHLGPITLKGPAGHIVFRSFDIKHRVVSDRWQIAASVDYDLWIDWNSVTTRNLTNVPQRAHLAEIV